MNAQQEYLELVKQAEQLRILKNLIKDPNVYMGDIEKVVKAIDRKSVV